MNLIPGSYEAILTHRLQEVLRHGFCEASCRRLFLLFPRPRVLSEPPSRDADANHLEAEPSFASGLVHRLPRCGSLKRRLGLCVTCPVREP